MTGADLQELIISKWGKSYDVQIRRIQGQVFVQIMWRYLEQASFPMGEEEYLAHLETIAQYLTGMGGASQVKAYLEQTSDRPRQGKAVSIPLNLGSRASEWLV